MPAPIAESRILEAALAVWREEGYRAATTRKVAQRAGIGEVTLFRRFGDKATLFSKALAYEAQRMLDNDLAFTGDVRHDLLQIAQAYDRMLDRNAAIVVDFLYGAPNEEELASLAPIPRETIATLARIVAQYQISGALRGETPFDVLLPLLSPILVQKMLSRAQPGLPLRDDLAARVDYFINGYRA
jgi:AcrR family transcriptional regulator